MTGLICRSQAKSTQVKVKSKLLASEKSGLIMQTREEILAEFKDELRRDGKL